MRTHRQILITLDSSVDDGKFDKFLGEITETVEQAACDYAASCVDDTYSVNVKQTYPLGDLYCVQVQLESKFQGWTSSRQLPIFYLNSNIQGIMSEESAKEIARAIVTNDPTVTVHVTAVKV